MPSAATVATSVGTDARLRRGERFCRADYRRVFAEGKSFPSRSFVAWLLDSGSAGSPRLGVVVSKRTFRHAVDRNRAKRLMREAFRLSKSHVREGLWVMLIGRRRIAAQDTVGEAVVREFQSFLKRSGAARESAR